MSPPPAGKSQGANALPTRDTLAVSWPIYKGANVRWKVFPGAPDVRARLGFYPAPPPEPRRAVIPSGFQGPQQPRGPQRSRFCFVGVETRLWFAGAEPRGILVPTDQTRIPPCAQSLAGPRAPSLRSGFRPRAQTPAKRLNLAALGISAAGSDAREAAQLHSR